MGRYTEVYSLDKNIYTKTCPILIVGGRLLKDNQSNQIVGQIKLKNIVTDSIKAIFVNIATYDVLHNSIDPSIEHQYLDLMLQRDEAYGEQVAICFTDDRVREITVEIKKVVFSDGKIWDNHNCETMQLHDCTPLDTDLSDELVQQYQRDCKNSYDSEMDSCALREYEDYWICTCGAMNWNDEDVCHKCGKNKEWIKTHLDKTLLQENLKDYNLEMEKRKKEWAKIQAEQKVEKEKQAKKRNKIIAITSIIAVCIFAIYQIVQFQEYNKLSKGIDKYVNTFSKKVGYDCEDEEWSDIISDPYSFKDGDLIESKYNLFDKKGGLYVYVDHDRYTPYLADIEVVSWKPDRMLTTEEINDIKKVLIKKYGDVEKEDYSLHDYISEYDSGDIYSWDIENKQGNKCVLNFIVDRQAKEVELQVINYDYLKEIKDEIEEEKKEEDDYDSDYDSDDYDDDYDSDYDSDSYDY